MGLVVDPFPADRRAQRGHRCYQGKVAFGRRWPGHQTKQDRFPPHACKLPGRRGGRGSGKTPCYPILNLERTAKKAERIGVGVAKRLALVQADIWAKRSEAGDIYELDPLLVEETTCTRTVFSTLVDDLAHQSHLLVRHNKGLRCKVCNVHRADRQFRFWSRHPCFPRPSAAVVIS